MPIYRFRIYFDEDESVYRDVAIRHNQAFLDLHLQILKSFEFDTRHRATFHRSNDNWQQGREISLERYEDRPYRVDPLLMADTTIASEIRNPNQKFLYTYDFQREWRFRVELIALASEENPKLTYPATLRREGIAPSQYGTKSILGDRFVDVEEKYDLAAASEGFGEEGEEHRGGASDPGEEAPPADDDI